VGGDAAAGAGASGIGTVRHLAVAMVAVVFIVIVRAVQVARNRDAVLIAVLAAPLGGAVLDCAYVVRVGGDYMHARFMIPSFFAMAMLTWLAVPRAKDARWSPVGALSLFALVCGAHFRYPNLKVIPLDGITNERLIWVSAADGSFCPGGHGAPGQRRNAERCRRRPGLDRVPAPHLIPPRDHRLARAAPTGLHAAGHERSARLPSGASEESGLMSFCDP
jgi:hypothetical protein